MFDRASARSAEQAFEHLFPDAEARHACMDFMAASMSLAHSRAPERWGVTLFTNAVRLNVGMIEVLTFAANQVHVVVDSDVISPDLNLLLGVTRSNAPYASVPSAAGCDFPAPAAAVDLPLLRVSHEALILKAAATRINAAARNAYSSGVATFLSRRRSPALAHPSYHVRQHHASKQNSSEGDEHRLFVQASEAIASLPLLEGAVFQVSVNRHERNPDARRQAIQHYGCRCMVCGFDFEKTYGQLGRGFIHVHHLKPLSEVDEEYIIDPIRDLRPVCANCHAVIHLAPDILSIGELKVLIHGAAPGRPENISAANTTPSVGNVLPGQADNPP